MQYKRKIMLTVAAVTLAGFMNVRAFNTAWSDASHADAGTDNTLHFDFSGQDRSGDAIGQADVFDDGFLYQLIIDIDGNTDFGAILTSGYDGYGWGINGDAWMDDAIATTDGLGTTDDYVLSEFWWGDRWTADWGVEGGPPGIIDQAVTFEDGEGNPLLNTSFYFRWFNSSDPATATEAGLIYNTAWQTPGDIMLPMETIRVGFDHDYNGVDNTGSIYSSGNPADGWQSMQMVPEPGTFALFGIGLLTVAAGKRKLRKSA